MTSKHYFKVTLTLTFEYHIEDPEEMEFQDEYDYNDETQEEFEERKKDVLATEKVYGSRDQIVSLIKGFHPLDFVEYVADGEVLSAEWHKDDFKITFIVRYDDPEATVDSVIRDLKMTSLEDGEYESCGTNGWTVKTLGELTEYGLTDYRDQPILVVEIPNPEAA